MRYVTVEGEGSEAVAEQVRENCDLWSWQEAQAALRAATGRSDTLVALYAAALTAPETQRRSLVEDFRAITRDPDPGLRQAVIIATGYLPWPGLVELVEELRDNDPERHVRENARLLLDAPASGTPGPG
ncbi:HEAT repeat domain-containing protein [Streptomyces sp. LZ34]